MSRSPFTAVFPLPAYTGSLAAPVMYRHSGGNLYPLGNVPTVSSGCSCVDRLVGLGSRNAQHGVDPVGGAELADGAACARGAFDAAVVVVVDDDAEAPLSLPPQPATNIPIAATRRLPPLAGAL